VPLAEVRPPRELLTLSWWAPTETSPRAGAPEPDYETIMRRTDGGADANGVVRVTRRHFPWTYREETAGDVRRRVIVTEASTGVRLDFSSNGIGRGMAITRSGPGRVEPRNLHTREQILGEMCEWFDMFPGLDVRWSECRTADGITLREDNTFRGTRKDFTAVRLSRRPIGFDEIMPPAEILDPKFWGLD
jgi:hypothetical protein